MIDDIRQDGIRRGFIVGMGSLVTAGDHGHPLLAVLNQAFIERLANGVARPHDVRIALPGEVVFYEIPSQFMGEFESLDGALFLKARKRALARSRYRFTENGQRP